ncbi:hypothetical protein F4823DRAFT_10717 [Ustulina deusta]|nr:hypothetical protein F4823DRAFT_10717 [Ustulina deusta]
MKKTCGELSRIPRDVRFQGCLADPNGMGEYRFLGNGKDIKYNTVEAGVIPPDDIYFDPALKSRLPISPQGDWNEGQAAENKLTKNVIFTTTIRYGLLGAKDIWYNQRIDQINA